MNEIEWMVIQLVWETERYLEARAAGHPDESARAYARGLG